MKNDTDQQPEPQAEDKPAGTKLLYRLTKVPEGRRNLRIKIRDTGWLVYPGKDIELTKKQADDLNAACPDCLQLKGTA